MFRHSKFASLDPSGRQVLTTPKHLIEKGEWGLKSTVLKKIKSPFIQVQHHDNENGLMKYKIATSKVAEVERWKELLPLPVNPHPLPRLLEKEFDSLPNGKSQNDLPPFIREIRAAFNPINLVNASKEKYENAIDRAWKYRKEFKKLVSLGFYTDRQWAHFLKVSVPVGGTYWNKTDEFKHLPVYRTRGFETETLPMPGRILNGLGFREGYAVGLAGYVAFLPLKHVPSYLGSLGMVERSQIYQFYPVASRITKNGAAEIIVSLEAPRDGPSNSLYIDGGKNMFARKLESRFEKVFAKTTPTKSAKDSTSFSFRN